MVFLRVGNWVKKKLLRYGKNWGFMRDGRGYLLRTSKLPERRAGNFGPSPLLCSQIMFKQKPKMLMV